MQPKNQYMGLPWCSVLSYDNLKRSTTIMLGWATDFRLDLGNGGMPFFVCKNGLVVCTCSAVGVSGGGVDGAPRFGATLRGTKKEAAMIFALCAIGVTKVAFRGRSTTKAFFFSVLSVLFEWLVTFCLFG